MKRPHKRLPPLRLLREELRYVKSTGRVTRRKRRSSSKDDRALTKYGYRALHLHGYGSFQEHRVIWKMVTGRDPGAREVDHRNGRRDENRWRNLRLAGRWQQTVNSALSSKNTSGFRGVWRRPSGRWCAQIRARKRTVTIGTFDTKREAAAAYQRAAARMHGRWARGLLAAA